MLFRQRLSWTRNKAPCLLASSSTPKIYETGLAFKSTQGKAMALAGHGFSQVQLTSISRVTCADEHDPSSVDRFLNRSNNMNDS